MAQVTALSTPHSRHCTLYTALSTPHSLHSTLYTALSTLHSLHSLQNALAAVFALSHRVIYKTLHHIKALSAHSTPSHCTLGRLVTPRHSLTQFPSPF